jgi:hypothetical protein
MIAYGSYFTSIFERCDAVMACDLAIACGTYLTSTFNGCNLVIAYGSYVDNIFDGCGVIQVHTSRKKWGRRPRRRSRRRRKYISMQKGSTWTALGKGLTRSWGIAGGGGPAGAVGAAVGTFFSFGAAVPLWSSLAATVCFT